MLTMIIIMSSAFAGCLFGGDDDDGDNDKRDLIIKGSTTVLPIGQALAENYTRDHDVDISLSGGGSSVGVTAAADGTAGIGMISRDLKDSEKTEYPDLQEYVIAADGIAVIVHNSNTVDDLSIAWIKDIYTGTYTNWNELGGPDETIVVMVRDSASGTGEFFSKEVLNKEEHVAGALEKNSNGAMAESIANTRGGIGYVGLGFLSDDVKALSISMETTRATELVEPTVENVKNGDYPIARNLYFITKGAPTGLAKEFIEFTLSQDGQAIVEDAGFVPIAETGRETGTLSIKGSTTVLPIAEAAAEEFMRLNPGVDVTVAGGGSSVGVTAVADGTVDIGMASRDLKDGEKADHPDLQEHVIAKDGIAVIVHLDNPVRVLNLSQIKDIYTGVITNWQDVGWDDETIVVMIRDSASGTGEFFWKEVLDKEEYVGGALEKNSNGAMHDSVMNTEGGIGYVGLGYLDEDVRAIKIDHNDMKLVPTVENVKRGTYPIARSLHFITNGDPAGLTKDFIDFVLSNDGQAIVEGEGFVSLVETHATGTLEIKGSTTVLPIAEAAAEAYRGYYDGVDITVSGGGSSVGVTAAADGTADIGMASRDLKDSEKADHPDLQEHVVARDGISVIVHNDNPVISLTLEQIRGIYNGTYTNWNEVGGGDMEIVVMIRDSASGTGEFFWKEVLEKDEYVDGALEKNSNGAMHDSVMNTEAGIGYVGLGYLDDDVQAIRIDVDGEFIEPTVANVQNGAYPIARSLHFITDGDPSGLALEFLNFLLSGEGQKIVESEGFVPLD